ncbi:hypothetical protein ACFL0C_02365 [Patescibacteria group bacterium]
MKIFRLFTTILLSTFILINSVVYAPKAHAFNLFRELRNTVRFVVKLPDKATRFLGPVLGPIASTILTKNIFKHQKLGAIFKKAHKAEKVIQDIETVKKQVDLLKKTYRDQAKEMRENAANLEEARKGLASKMVKDKNYSYDDFKNDVVSIQNLVEVYKKAGEKFENAANRVGPKDVAGMLGENLLKKALGDIKEAVIFEASAELEKFIDPNVISRFLDNRSGAGGLDAVLDFFVLRELGDSTDSMSEEELKEFLKRTKKSIRNSLKENSDFFKDNWREKLNEVINKEIERIEMEANKVNEKVKNNIDSEKEENEPQFAEKDFGGDEQCGPGYEYNRRFASCVQANCDKITDAHYSYEGYCLCGSSGSIAEDPKDPNKECGYPRSYTSCPGCLTSCVHLNEDCPKLD